MVALLLYFVRYVHGYMKSFPEGRAGELGEYVWFTKLLRKLVDLIC